MKKRTFTEYTFDCTDVKEKLGIENEGEICFISHNSFGKTLTIRIRQEDE